MPRRENEEKVRLKATHCEIEIRRKKVSKATELIKSGGMENRRRSTTTTGGKLYNQGDGDGSQKDPFGEFKKKICKSSQQG